MYCRIAFHEQHTLQAISDDDVEKLSRCLQRWGVAVRGLFAQLRRMSCSLCLLILQVGLTAIPPPHSSMRRALWSKWCRNQVCTMMKRVGWEKKDKKERKKERKKGRQTDRQTDRKKEIYFIVVSSPKKGNLPQCQNYRTISLISHPSKVMLKVILNKLKPQAEKIIAEEQAGFRAGRSTTEQIFNLRILCEKYFQHQQDLYHVFIDFKKAFDRVWHAAYH